MKFDSYRQILSEELKSRCRKNRAYSLRAFARDLGLSPSRVSEILRGKQGISVLSAEKILEKIAWEFDKKEDFLRRVRAENSRSKFVRFEVSSDIEKERLSSTSPLREENFSLISDWRYLAILEYLTMKNGEASTADIALHFGISVDETERLLLNLDLVREIELNQGQVRLLTPATRTSDELDSPAIRRHHRQILEKAISSLSEQGLSDRENSSVTCALSDEDVKWLKDAIKQFRDRMVTEIMTRKSKKGSVYCLNLNLFCLDRSKNKGQKS